MAAGCTAAPEKKVTNCFAGTKVSLSFIDEMQSGSLSWRASRRDEVELGASGAPLLAHARIAPCPKKTKGRAMEMEKRSNEMTSQAREIRLNGYG